MYTIMFVLDNPDQLDNVLDVWEGIGVRGVTIVESTGIHRRRKQTVPMRYLFQTAGDIEEGHLTLFALVEDEHIAAECLEATEALIGDLSQPNSGVFAAWPVALVKGVPKSYLQGE